MTDFNEALDGGGCRQGTPTAVIGSPRDSGHKIEWDRTLFRLNRVKPAVFAKPVN